MGNKDEPVVQAHQSFLKNNFTGALQHLTELEKLIGTPNSSVQHNKCVVDFMSGNMKNIAKFKKDITQVIGVNFPDTQVKNGLSPFIIYNYAVLLYHSRYYFQCAVLLERLLPTIKTIKDKNLAQQIVLLLMEATLCRRTYSKTLEIAKNCGDLVKENNDKTELFERLVARAQVLLGNKEALTLKPNIIENAFIIAQHQCLNGEHKESVDTLAQYKTIKHNYDLKSQGEDIWAAINNNLAVVYMHLRKPYLATKYFQHAVKEHFKVMENDDSKRLITCRDRPLFVFNLGLTLLAANNPDGAFECLVEAVRHYPNNPRIWMRLADCCVRKCCGDDTQQYTVKKLGSGSHTRILLAKEGKEKYSVSGESFAIPSLSLEFAALCLRNAITLLQCHDYPDATTMIQTPPGPPITWKQACELRNSVLVLQSYILLHLQDFLAALACANELLGHMDASNNHKAWAHIYAAEALINLDRITDAVEHLNPPMIHELVSVLPPQMRDMIGVSVWAKAAVCHILRGDLVTARKILLQINSPRVLPLQMYLEICTGNFENCHALLRKLRFTSVSS